MRVLLATDGTWGDVGPLLAVGRALVERGHEVCAVLNPDFADAGARVGLAVRPAGVSWEERLVDVDPERVMRPLSGTLRVLRDFLLPDVPTWFAATDAAAEDFRPEAALVHHVCWGSLAAAERRGLPLAATFLAPTVLLSAADPGRPLAALPEPPRPVARVSVAFMRRLFRHVLDRPARLWFERAGLPPPLDLFFLAQRAAHDCLALWSAALRGPAADDPPHLHVCGYAFPVEPDPLAPELEAFLAAGEAPVVVTLGTSARRVGLDLYRATAEACARIGRRAVLLTGGPESRPDALPPGIVAFDEAPHGRLLSRACAVVHHAGAGTGAQALRAGVPSLIVPFGHDQADNAFRMQRLGGARVLSRRRATAERIAAQLRALLEDGDARAAAASVGERVRSEDGAREAARRVEALARREARDQPTLSGERPVGRPRSS